VHHIWCPLFSQEFQDLPDGAETTLTDNVPEYEEIRRDELNLLYVAATRARKTLVLNSVLRQILANSRLTG
ncbi:TPA: hypothetical protein ACQFCS_005450, partial [Escherichia coli]